MRSEHNTLEKAVKLCYIIHKEKPEHRAPENLKGVQHMDINKVTVKELLDNQKACDVMNSIDPKILKSPMVKLVKGKTIAAVFAMVPDAKVSAETKAKIREALAEI